MATPAAQLDRSAVQEQAVRHVRELLAELGGPAASCPDGFFRPEVHLEKDLGLGSLERVELISRLARGFQVSVPDQIAAEADTLGDLLAAVLSARNGTAPPLGSPGLLRPAEVPPAGLRADSAPGPLPAAGTLLDVILHRGAADAARPHLYLSDEAGASRVLSFGELFERSRAVAGALSARGLEPGDCVALMLPTSAEFFASFLGVILAGGVAVPIYPPVRADRMEEYARRQSAILRSAQAKFLLTFPQAGGVARLLRPLVPSLREVLSAADLMVSGGNSFPITHRARPADLALLQYTSGSTGEPKGVMLTHANLLANIRAITEAVAFRAEDVAVSWLPLYHDMGLIGAWLTPLYFGLPLVVMSPMAFLNRPARWLWAVHHHRGTISAAPNFAFEMCVRRIQERDLEGLNLSSWRAVLNGAEPVNPRTLDRFCERFSKYSFRPPALLPVYGLAEATLCVTAPSPAPERESWRVDRIDRATFERDGRAVPAAHDDESPLEFVGVGGALPTMEVRISDADGRELPERVEGNLWFRGPSVTPGYFRNPEATRDLFREDPDSPGGAKWVDSGDRAYRADGEFFITGRVKDIIIKAGRNIYPHEIEEAAHDLKGIRRGCVVAFGISDAAAGTERLVVVAETRERLNGPERGRVEAALLSRISEAAGVPPDIIELLPAGSIPKTTSGKLRRSETRRLYLAGKLSQAKPPVWLQVARLAASGVHLRTRSVARRALELLYGIYSAFAFTIFLLPTWAAAKLAPTREQACRYTQIGSRIFFRLMFIPIEVRGWEHLRGGGPWVLVANHTSFFDVVLFLALNRFPYRFVSKREVASWPFIGTFLNRRDDFRFTREDRGARLEQAEALERSLRENVSLLIFPEGTFVASDGVRAFQLGAFKAAYAARCPVVPIALRGVRSILRDETVLPRPGRITVTICPPLQPNPEAPEFSELVRLRDAARAAIAEHCGEHLM